MATLMNENTIQLTIDGAIARLTINRPENLNALNADVLQGLILSFEKIQKATTVRVVTITGAGEKSFVAGADIAMMAQLGPRAIADYVELGQRAMRTIETSPQVVIAAVNGYALGGGLELALACDLIVAHDRVKLGQPEVNLGIIPGFGGTQRLLQRCGSGAARRLVYSGDIIDAAEALRLGVVDQVVAPDELTTCVESLAERILSKGPLAVRGAKRVINAATEAALLSGLRLEVEEFLRLFHTADREEGMTAFMQKRPAKFTGR